MEVITQDKSILMEKNQYKITLCIAKLTQSVEELVEENKMIFNFWIMQNGPSQDFSSLRTKQ